MGNRNFAYIRVSTKEQNIDRQLQAIKNLPDEIDERDVYIDKLSGKNLDRPEYQAMKRSIRSGDTLFIKEIDRLGRNKQDILNEWKYYVENNIRVVVIDMPILDTRNQNESIVKLIAEILLTLLSWMAEEERDKIRKRQKEGIEAAKIKGKKFGRPEVEKPELFDWYLEQVDNGNMTAVQAIEKMKITKFAFYKFKKES